MNFKNWLEIRASAEIEALKEVGLTERPPRGTAEWLLFQDVLDTHKQIAAIRGETRRLIAMEIL